MMIQIAPSALAIVDASSTQRTQTLSRCDMGSHGSTLVCWPAMQPISLVTAQTPTMQHAPVSHKPIDLLSCTLGT